MSTTPTTTPTATIGWFEISGPDMGALESFYGDVFGWTWGDSPMGPTYRLAETGGVPGGLTAPQDGLPANYAIFSLQVDDVAATCEAITAAGGKVLVGPVEVPSGLVYANVADPAGSHFGLYQLG